MRLSHTIDSSVNFVLYLFYCSLRIDDGDMMAVEYQVVSFGVPQAPWRAREKQAQIDAVALGLAEVDEWGQLFFEAASEIVWRRVEDVRLSA